MNDNHDVEALRAEVADLRRRDERRESEHVSLLNSYAALAAGREALRQDLQLNVDYITDRLESLKARPAGGTDTEWAEAEEEIYKALLQLLKLQNATDERLDWLIGIVTRNMERQSQIADLNNKLLDLIEQVQRVASAR